MRVLIADSLERFLSREPRARSDYEITLFPAASIPAGDFAGLMPDITRRVTAANLAKLPVLRIIANYGAGYDNIDVASARARGIAVTNTPGVLTQATAELTWALILAVARRVGEGERLVRAHAWQGWQPTHHLGFGLDGKTLGIVGAGRIGREVGRRAPAFGMKVVYTSRERHADFEAAIGAERTSLEELLAVADIVSLHLSLSPETRHLIGAAQLAAMMPSAVLINTARGPIVDESALIDALRTRRIRSAGLDVYEREPAIPAALRDLDHVVLLPHLGSATEETRQAMWDLAWRNLEAGLQGRPLLNPVP